MEASFDRAGLVEIGGTVVGAPDRQKAKLIVQFDVNMEDHFPRVEILLSIGRNLDSTLRSMNEESRLTAITLLKKAVEILENSTLEELQQITLKQDAKADLEMDAKLQASLDASLNLIPT